MNPIIAGRINALRQIMKADGIDAVIIPQTDPHQSEYLAEHWEARRWLSGFTGSAGTLVVTTDEALLWTDSRYFIQAATQLDGSGITLMKEGLPDTPGIEQYLTSRLPAGSTVGVDGMLFSVTSISQMRRAFESAGFFLNTCFTPLDTIWTNRPELPSDSVFIHDDKYAGENAASKIDRVLSKATGLGANSVFISGLDEIAWTLNIRCSDVPCNPVATSFLFLSADRKALFINEKKIDDKVRDYLASFDIEIMPYEEVPHFLTLLPASQRVLIEPSRTADTLATILGKRAVAGPSAVAMFKAVKNVTQLKGTRDAMERDGAALVKMFMEIERALKAGEKITELDVERLGQKYRGMSEMYFDDSFGMIAGYGPHGAIVHYSATESTNATLEPHGLLLVDSGAQYFDGTTDITRTVALGTPTEQEKHDFTLVMKGHIALGTAIFPEGTRGDQLDALARQFLWKEGLSYLHGTGHGVGHFLNVHEGPQSIRLNHVNTPLTPDMITSNEPGLYREDIHGIRCENLVLTVPAMTTEFGNFYKFETLTLFPFDRSLFDLSLMTEAEINWVDTYHATVRQRLMPHLSTESERTWLTEKTEPLRN